VSKLAQFQKDGLLSVRTLLNPHDPCNPASDEIKEQLKAMWPWLSSNVLTAVDTIDSPNEYEHRWMREETSRRARRIRLAQQRGAHSPDPWPPTAKEGKR